MANPNPYQARATRRRKRGGNMQQLSVKLWRALETAEELLDSADSGERLKAIHAMSQVAGSYARVYEVGELEARITALEEARREDELKAPSAENDLPGLGVEA